MACVSFVQAQGLTTYTILNEFNDDGVPPGSGVRPLFEFNAWALDEPALFRATSGSIVFYGSFEIQPQSVVKLTMQGGQAFDLNSVNLDQNEGWRAGGRDLVEIYPGVMVFTDLRPENGVMIVRASDGTTQEVTREGEIDFDIRAVEWVEFISVSAKLHIKGFTFATSEDYQPALKSPAINESQRAPTMQELISSQGNTTELDAAIAERDAAIAQRDAAIAERDARPTADQLAAVEAERDSRPTADQLAAVEAERDARYTEDQIRGLSADYTIGLNEAGNVQMKFNLFESADLNTFAPLTLNPDSVSVVDGSICLEFAPEDRAAFFRFSVE